MATKSILKTVHIKNKKSAANLAYALENACARRGKEVSYSRLPSTATKEEIQDMFKKRT